ncbi:hypothetical protein BDW71DRAFT_166672 [Aspergillus fruticulosus]
MTEGNLVFCDTFFFCPPLGCFCFSAALTQFAVMKLGWHMFKYVLLLEYGLGLIRFIFLHYVLSNFFFFGSVFQFCTIMSFTMALYSSTTFYGPGFKFRSPCLSCYSHVRIVFDVSIPALALSNLIFAA